MKVIGIKTRNFLPPKDSIKDLLSYIQSLNENSVVAITSKVISICEGRCVSIDKITKDELAIKEADKYIAREFSPNGWVLHTIKNNMLIASAGVDESNGANHFILWPKNPYKSAKIVWEILTKKFKIKNLGVIITDSRLIPLRRGVVGITIGFFGFKPLKDYRGREDLFGRKLKMETSNMPDSLATVAVLEMGEGSEGRPIAIISDISDIEFINKKYIPKTIDDSFEIPEKEDMFYPFLSKAKWKKGGEGS